MRKIGPLRWRATSLISLTRSSGDLKAALFLPAMCLNAKWEPPQVLQLYVQPRHVKIAVMG